MGKRKRGFWTQGRALHFKAGDLIHGPGVLLQVVAAKKASTDDAGQVDFDTYHPVIGQRRYMRTQSWTCSQAEFANLLRTGLLHGGSLIPATDSAA